VHNIPGRLRFWPEGWIEYLKSEREGTRASVARFGAFIVTLFVAMLATFFAIPRIQLPTGLAILTALIYLWGLACVTTAAYVWAQYLGTLKAISRRYLDPAEHSQNQLERPEIRHADFWEVSLMDPGHVVQLVTIRQTSDDVATTLGRVPNPPPDRLRVQFARFLISSTIATVLAPLAAYNTVPCWLASLMYLVSLLLLGAFVFGLRRCLRSISSILRQRTG
jgi:hypothetical protein